MHYALDLRTFFHSHYFHLGLRVAFGLLGLTLATRAVSDMDTATTVCIGALCVSLMEMPSPLRHKFNEMMAAALLCTAVTLIISLCGPLPWLRGLMVVFMSFWASMMVVYGKKTLPLLLATLFIMALSTEHNMSARQSFAHAAVFLGGGLAYLAYSMAVSWCLRHRLKQQVLAEALFELAHYVDIKADFYDTRYNLAEQFSALVRHQSILADRQQAARDLILRGHDKRRDSIVAQVHVGMLDLYELILSTHTDYAQLRAHLADSEVLAALHDLAYKAARDIESVAYAVTRKRASHATISYAPEMQAIEAALAGLQRRGAAGEPTQEAQAVLRAQRNKVQLIIRAIGELHQASQRVADAAPLWEGADIAPFLSQQRYELGLIRANLRMSSAIFRFALRLALGVAAGLVVAELLPYTAHSYWIVLTIVIILRPSFAVTKQRLRDRVIGTMVGCLLTALTLHFVQSELVLVGILFVAMVAMPTFLYLRYRFTAVAVSMMILLQMHLMAPDDSGLIAERLIDTLIGALLASAFSFVLASWEYRSLPQLIRRVLDTNRRYMTASYALLQGGGDNDMDYRAERKRLLDSLAGLSAALLRMLDEPSSKQRAAADISQFIVQNYLLVAHVAALRALLLRHAKDLPAAELNPLLAQSQRQVDRCLGHALREQGGAAAGPAPVPTEAADGAPPEGAGAPGWSGWSQLRRRLRLLHADADRIAVHSTAIARDVDRLKHDGEPPGRAAGTGTAGARR